MSKTVSAPLKGICNLEAIVLAGGSSRRMGQDKALLELNDVPLLQHVCEVAAACARQTYIVTPWGDRYSHLQLSAKFVVEPTESGAPLGPLVGFASGLEATRSEWVLLLACDLPFLNAASLQRGAARLAQLSPDIVAMLHPHSKGWDPLCGFYRRCCLSNAQAAIAAGIRSLQSWLSEQAIAVWENADPQLFVNCNTPEDWSQVSDSSTTS